MYHQHQLMLATIMKSNKNKSMEHLWSIICQKSSVDRETNSLSLFNCAEQMDITLPLDNNKQEKRNIPVQFEIVSLWRDKENTKKRNFDLQIELFDPNNKKLNQFTIKTIFPERKKQLRTIIKINGLAITSAGEYKFKISYKEIGKTKFERATEIPLDINLGYKQI